MTILQKADTVQDLKPEFAVLKSEKAGEATYLCRILAQDATFKLPQASNEYQQQSF